jgi:hypothetical protein
LELSFETLEVRDICEKLETATERLGPFASAALIRCLADIEAMETMAEITAFFPDELDSLSPDEKALQFEAGYSLVFRSGHARTPKTSTGNTDWKRVTRLRIMAVRSMS